MPTVIQIANGSTLSDKNIGLAEESKLNNIKTPSIRYENKKHPSGC